jgi:hypothetical protein
MGRYMSRIGGRVFKNILKGVRLVGVGQLIGVVRRESGWEWRGRL